MADFTPGPWQAVVGKTAGRQVISLAAVSKSRHSVAHVGGPDRDANARLIAAAPDLLAALDHYADQLCEGWCEQSPDCAHFDDCGGCLARRTAWKARGQ